MSHDEQPPPGESPPDAELTAAIRRGDDGSGLARLYERHRPAVLSYARTCCRDAHTAEDLTSEAFARTLQAVRSGRGPVDAWRPYLLSVVRNTATDWSRTARRTELAPDFERWCQDMPDAPTEESGEQRMVRLEDDSMLLHGFRALPERWQAVLWHTVVEAESTEAVGRMLGMSPSGVTSLAARAREGLREAYLTAHAESAGESDTCRYSGQLGAYVRRGGRANKPLRRHLAGCSRCRTAVVELTDLNQRLRGVLPAGLLLWGASAYLTARGAETAVIAGQAGAHGGGYAAAAGTGGGSSTSGMLAAVKTPLVGGAAATVAVGGLVLGGLTLPGDGEEPTPDAGPSARAQQPQPSDQPRSPSASRGSPSPTPSPSESSTVPEIRAREPENGPASSLAPADARTTLRVASTKRCMQIPQGSGAEGAQPREAACDGSGGQQWGLLLPYDNDRSRVQLRNQGTGLCLTNSGTTNDGAPVRQQDCDRAETRQLWRMYGGDEGEVRFADQSGEMFLGLRDWSAGEKGTEHAPGIATSHHYYASPSFGFTVPGPLFEG